MLHDFFSTRASKLSRSSEGDATKRTHTHTDTHTQEYLSPMFFTAFSTASSHFSLLLLMLSLLLLLLFFFCLFSHSESKKKEKRTLDGLLKLCNVKAKQMCFYYLCL